MSPRSWDSGRILAQLELEKRRLMRQLESVELRNVAILQRLAGIELKKRKILPKPETPLR
jgi:hypothetical protein